MSLPDTTFGKGQLALALLTLDPAGLGGVVIRARSGPVRAALLDSLGDAPVVKLHPAVADEALFGGLDLSATLAAGRIVQGSGLLDRAGPMILTSAERTTAGLAARLAVQCGQRDAGASPDAVALHGAGFCNGEDERGV